MNEEQLNKDLAKIWGAKKEEEAQDVAATLEQRGKQYGAFTQHAAITQALKAVMRCTKNWEDLHADQKEALEMTAHKIGRILNGNKDYVDSWVDIEGYIRLVRTRLETGKEV